MPMRRELHTCPECCIALGYLESILKMDMHLPSVSVWWKIRHPLHWHWVKGRRDHAMDLLDEAGK